MICSTLHTVPSELKHLCAFSTWTTLHRSRKLLPIFPPESGQPFTPTWMSFRMGEGIFHGDRSFCRLLWTGFELRVQISFEVLMCRDLHKRLQFLRALWDKASSWPNSGKDSRVRSEWKFSRDCPSGSTVNSRWLLFVYILMDFLGICHFHYTGVNMRLFVRKFIFSFLHTTFFLSFCE